jgi:multidrug efflux pump subunit AcrA (membrane-fusion protein)
MRHFIVMVAVVTFVAGCDRPAPAGAGPAEQRQNPQQPPAVEVSLGRSSVGPIERSIEVVGTLYGDEEAQISAKVAGQIVEIHKDVGDTATAGEPLAQIDPVTYRLLRDQGWMSLQQALAALGLKDVPQGDVNVTEIPTVVQRRLQAENAQRRFERARELFTGSAGSISEQEFTDLRTAAEVARSEYDVQLLNVQSQLADIQVRQAELRMRDQRLADTTIRAPLRPGQMPSTQPTTQPGGRNYVISARQVSLGEYVREGTPVFRVVADDPIKYRANVPERFINRVRVGQNVRLHVEGRNQTFNGRLARVNPQVDPTSRTFQIEAIFQNPDHSLRPGQFARGDIVIGHDENITFVPADAIVSFAGVVRVFTVKDGKAVEHRVTTGQAVDGKTEIVQGFSGEADVVTRGGSRLADGVPVQVAAAPPSTAPSQ